MHRYSRPLLVAAAGVLALLVVGGFIPPDVLRSVTVLEGDLLHGMGVGLLAFLIVLALPRWWLISTATLLVSIGLAELLQPIFGRSAEWSDFQAGGLGLLVGAVAASATSKAVRATRSG